MKKIIVIGMCILMILPILVVGASLNQEKSSTARIVGDTPYDISQQLLDDDLRLDKTWVEGYNDIKGLGLLRNQFGDTYRLSTIFNSHANVNRQNELFIHTGNTKTKNGAYDIKGLKNNLHQDFSGLMITTGESSGLYFPKKYSNMQSFLTKGTVIAPSREGSEDILLSILCNLNSYKTIGEIYRKARNDYYQQLGSNDYVGLVLQSYNLFGSPFQKVVLPLVHESTLKKYCGKFINSKLKTKIQKQKQVTFEPVVNGEFIIDDYSTVSYDNYTLIDIQGSTQNKEFFSLVLPSMQQVHKFPSNTIFTNISTPIFSDSIELVIDDLPQWQGEYVKRECYNVTQSAEFSIDHWNDGNQETLVVSTIPIEIIDCKTGLIRIYRKVNYIIDYMPNSPVMIDSITFPDKVVPSKDFAIVTNIHFVDQIYEPISIGLISNGQVIQSQPIIQNNVEYMFNLPAPAIQGLNSYELVVIRGEDVIFAKSISIDISNLDGELSGKMIYNTPIATLKIDSEIQTPIFILAHLLSNGIELESTEKTIVIDKGITSLSIPFNDVEGKNNHYELIVDLLYNNTIKTLSTMVLTNHPPYIEPFEPITISKGESINIPINAKDPDGDNLTFSANNNEVIITDKNISWTALQIGNYSIIITASDGIEQYEQILNINVIDTCDNQEINPDICQATISQSFSIWTGEQLIIPLDANTDGTPLLNSNGKLNWRPNQTGNYTYEVMSANGPVSLNIEVNSPPLIIEQSGKITPIGTEDVVLFKDDFNDNQVNSSLWKTEGDTVTQDGTLKVIENGEPGGMLKSNFYPLSGKLKIERKVKITPIDHNFAGAMAFYSTGFPGTLFGLRYTDYARGSCPRNGVWMYRNSQSSLNCGNEWSPFYPIPWAEWSQETLEIDIDNHKAEYSRDGTKLFDYDLGTIPPNKQFQLQISAWGFTDGNIQEFDDIVVSKTELMKLQLSDNQWQRQIDGSYAFTGSSLPPYVDISIQDRIVRVQLFEEAILCHQNIDCGKDAFIGEEYCLGTKALRNKMTFTCNQPGTIQSSCTSSTHPKEIPESTLCQPIITCHQDTDCGRDAFIGDEYCMENNALRVKRTYTCYQPGTSQSSCGSITQPERIVESTLCEPVSCEQTQTCETTVSLNLHPGLNLISIPFENITASSFRELTNAAFLVRRRNGNFEPYIRGLTQDYNLMPGEGYLVSIPQAKLVSFTGKLPKSLTYTLSSGLHFIGVPFNKYSTTDIARIFQASWVINQDANTSFVSVKESNAPIKMTQGFIIAIPHNVVITMPLSPTLPLLKTADKSAIHALQAYGIKIE